MSKFNVSDALKKADDELGLKDYFKPQGGDNKIRLLSPFVGHKDEYQGKISVKFVAWVWDYRSNNVKAYFMPRTIVDAIGALQSNPEYAFDELPMPYDITVNAVNAGTKEVKYTVTPARANTPVAKEQLEALKEKGTIEEYLKGLDGNKTAETTTEKIIDQTIGVANEGEEDDSDILFK